MFSPLLIKTVINLRRTAAHVTVRYELIWRQKARMIHHVQTSLFSAQRRLFQPQIQLQIGQPPDRLIEFRLYQCLVCYLFQGGAGLAVIGAPSGASVLAFQRPEAVSFLTFNHILYAIQGIWNDVGVKWLPEFREFGTGMDSDRYRQPLG